MLVGHDAAHDTPPRVVGRAWHGPPPDVVGDPLPLHCTVGQFRGSEGIIFFFIFSKNMIIKDQQTLLDSMHATVNIKLEYPQIFQCVFMDFLKNILTRPFFELEKCSFF